MMMTTNMMLPMMMSIIIMVILHAVVMAVVGIAVIFVHIAAARGQLRYVFMSLCLAQCSDPPSGSLVST